MDAWSMAILTVIASFFLGYLVGDLHGFREGNAHHNNIVRWAEEEEDDD